MKFWTFFKSWWTWIIFLIWLLTVIWLLFFNVKDFNAAIPLTMMFSLCVILDAVQLDPVWSTKKARVRGR